MLNQLNTTTKRELDVRYQSNSEEIQEIEDKLQRSKQISNTSGSFEISDYGLTESIELYFKPSQDLHGYSKPWVGGAGKNLLPIPDLPTTINGVRFSRNDDGSIKIEGLPSSSNWTTLTLATNLPLSSQCVATCEGGNDSTCFLEIDTVRVYQNISTSLSGTIGVAQISVAPQFSGTAILKPMIRLATETDATFEPYANICPIIGQDKASLTWNTNQGITMNFGTTYYGGIANFDGVLSLDWQRIASYDGETLSGEWLSDRDEYASGTTPSTGAEVVYKTTTSTVRVTKPVSNVLTDDYPISYNGYKLDVTYQPKDTILEEAKTYTNEEIAKLGLPQAPTSNGTYNLVCTVSSGVPTLSWESTT